MNKTIRNNALRDATRLIVAEYNGQDWYTDTYFATKYNIFEGYKQKKSQELHANGVNGNGKPKLKTIIENGNSYAPAKATEQAPAINEVMSTKLETRKNTEKIQTIYYKLMQTLGADKFEVSERHLDPVRVYKNNQLIGVVMPLRS